MEQIFIHSFSGNFFTYQPAHKILVLMVCTLSLCLLGNFAILSSADPFKTNFFGTFYQECSSEFQTVWIQIRPDFFVGPVLGPNCLQRLSANGTSRQRVKIFFKYSCTAI